MKAGPLKSWLARQGAPHPFPFWDAALHLIDRLSGQGLKLLATDDPWFVRELVEEEIQRQRYLNVEERQLPAFRQGADPCFGDRPVLGIVGVEPGFPMRLLTTNLAIKHRAPDLRRLIESQRFWSDDPTHERKGIRVGVQSGDQRINTGPLSEDQILVHTGAMWITPSLRGRRQDGPPLAASLAPLMRLCAWLQFSPDLLVGTVADPKLTQTFGSRKDGEIVLTENGEESRQVLHVYDASDMRTCAETVMSEALPKRAVG